MIACVGRWLDSLLTEGATRRCVESWTWIVTCRRCRCRCCCCWISNVHWAWVHWLDCDDARILHAACYWLSPLLRSAQCTAQLLQPSWMCSCSGRNVVSLNGTSHDCTVLVFVVHHFSFLCMLKLATTTVYHNSLSLFCCRYIRLMKILIRMFIPFLHLFCLYSSEVCCTHTHTFLNAWISWGFSCTRNTGKSTFCDFCYIYILNGTRLVGFFWRHVLYCSVVTSDPDDIKAFTSWFLYFSLVLLCK